MFLVSQVRAACGPEVVSEGEEGRYGLFAPSAESATRADGAKVKFLGEEPFETKASFCQVLPTDLGLFLGCRENAR